MATQKEVTAMRIGELLDERDKLKQALRELVEKAEAFPRVQWKCDCANPDLHEGCPYWDAEKKNAKLDAAIAKAKSVLGKKKGARIWTRVY